MTLIIVESPTKARTFNRILKAQSAAPASDAKKPATKSKKAPAKKPVVKNESGYYVFATLGHIRDLPGDKMAIDFAHDFAPEYQIMQKKQKVVAQLTELAKEHDEIIFATDPDREGESISYHAAYILGLMKENWPDISVAEGKSAKRIVFHEITQKALEEALAHPGEIRLDLVKAQQARRILDRIVGYELSPLLWKKLGKNWLSAGRVQSVALRFVVEREKEIRAFSKEPYYQVGGIFMDGEEELKARLIEHEGTKFEQQFKLKLFAGEYTYTKTTIGESNVDQILSDLDGDVYKIADIQAADAKRYPPPPFTTSLLQQEAINRYGFTSKMVMRLAQDLYERGLITYHRTDSFNLSTSFVFRAKDYITEAFGPEYALEKPRGYKTKSASAQEAHEAIRPTRADRDPAEISSDAKLTKNHKLLYQLIFNRAIATQMKEADIKNTKVFVEGTRGYRFETDFAQIIFDGFLKLLSPEYVEKHREAVSYKAGEELTIKSLDREEKQTLPPPRYSEATLIKVLEERGIGRPSTYAAILSLIQEKGYVEKDGRYLKSTGLGEAISDYLSTAFPQIFDINFTATMEQDLDRIADSEVKLLDILRDFYTPFAKELAVRQKDEGKIEVKEEISEVCPKCGKPLQLRFSRFGKFYACSGYPDCKFTKPYLKAVEGKICPKDGGVVVVRYTRAKKKFYGCVNYPACDYTEFVWSKLVPAPGAPGPTQTK